MRNGMRLLLVASASLLTAQTSAPAPAPASADTIWYVIAADNGTRLGYSSRQTIDTPAGRQVIDYSQIRLREQPTDPSWRLSERSVTRLDPSGRVVSISDESHMGLV